MYLAQRFQEIAGALPEDWTDVELDLRILDEQRYTEAATFLCQCNAQPYSRAGWHWRLIVANSFGHAAAVPAVIATLRLLDESGMEGELRLREVREGRAEVQPTWGRPEIVRQELKQRRSLC